jgi:hypothetical protein
MKNVLLYIINKKTIGGRAGCGGYLENIISIEVCPWGFHEHAHEAFTSSACS